MNIGLHGFANYKAGGRKNAFAEFMWWSPLHLTKLPKGSGFGPQPVFPILSVSAETEVVSSMGLQRQTLAYFLSLLDFDKYISVMTGEEVREFEEAIKNGRYPNFSPDTLSDFHKRSTERTDSINLKFAQATALSDELCRRKTAKK